MGEERDEERGGVKQGRPKSLYSNIMPPTNEQGSNCSWSKMSALDHVIFTTLHRKERMQGTFWEHHEVWCMDKSHPLYAPHPSTKPSSLLLFLHLCSTLHVHSNKLFDVSYQQLLLLPLPSHPLLHCPCFAAVCLHRTLLGLPEL